VLSLAPLAVIFVTFFLPFCQDSSLHGTQGPLVPLSYGLEHASELRSIASLPVFLLPLLFIAVVALALLRRAPPRPAEAVLATACLLVMPVAELAEAGARLAQYPADYPTLLFFLPALLGLYLLWSSRQTEGWVRWRRITAAYLAFVLTAPVTGDAVVWYKSLLVGGELYLAALVTLLLVLAQSFLGAQ
jgi:peptidoglycan/LPS O-acetylase OafA/YrhL